MAWLEGWSYRKAIIITENSGSNLIDFQVRIDLNNTNFDFTKANADGSDIRITTDDEITLLPYYIEKWDSTNQQAVIWVKVPSIPAGSSVTIYMYYGNPNAVSESDGKAVFDFFDDFETWVGWVQYRNGRVSQSNVQARSGAFSAKKANYGDPNGAYKDLGFTLDYPFVLEAYINRTYFSGSNIDRVGVIDNSGNGYGPAVSMDIPDVGIDKRDRYIGTPNNKAQLTTGIGNEWYKVKFYWNNGEMKAEVYDKYEAILGSTTYTDTTYTSFTRVYIFGGYTYFVDDIFIRKYAPIEPTCTMGEGAQPSYISGVVTFSDGTPASNCTVVAIDESTYNVIEVTTTAADGTYTISGLNTLKRYTVIVIPADNFQNGDIKCHVSPVS